MVKSATAAVQPQAKKLVPRIMALLDVLRTASVPLSAAEASRRIGLPLQTTHRLLGELSEGGLTFQHAGTKAWSLGPAAIGLGAAAGRQLTIVDVARPALEQVCAATLETVTLTLRDGAYGTYVDIIESPQQVRLVEAVGARLPLNVGASRMVIAATLEPEDRNQVFRDLHRLGILPDIGAAVAECEQIRDQGYAMSKSAVTAGSVGVSMAIVTPGLATRASLSVGGPQHRFDDEIIPKTVETLRSATAGVAAAMMRTHGIAEMDTEPYDGLDGVSLADRRQRVFHSRLP